MNSLEGAFVLRWRSFHLFSLEKFTHSAEVKRKTRGKLMEINLAACSTVETTLISCPSSLLKTLTAGKALKNKEDKNKKNIWGGKLRRAAVRYQSYYYFYLVVSFLKYIHVALDWNVLLSVWYKHSSRFIRPGWAECAPGWIDSVITAASSDSLGWINENIRHKAAEITRPLNLQSALELTSEILWRSIEIQPGGGKGFNLFYRETASVVNQPHPVKGRGGQGERER